MRYLFATLTAIGLLFALWGFVGLASIVFLFGLFIFLAKPTL